MKRVLLIASMTMLTPGAAAAQSGATVQTSCAAHLNTSPGDSVTLGAVLNCLAEMQRTIDRLKDARADAIPVSIPEGAVVAFDRPGRCPSGWSNFDEATSRVIVGAYFDRGAAVVEAPTEDENGEKLSARHYRMWGGEENHELTVPEMPKHQHVVEGLRTLGPATGDRNSDIPTAVLTETKGWHGVYSDAKTTNDVPETGHPHNNMPPYIALYFCKKER